MDLKMLVATHKKVDIPSISCYFPVQVGTALNDTIPDYLRDDTGENISTENPYYSELTGVYWAFKNLHADYVGLAHYRRYFANSWWSSMKKHPTTKDYLSESKAKQLLQSVDIILPTKRRYFIESVYDHYAHTLYEEDLLATEKIIEQLCPAYSVEFQQLKVRRSAHMFNMFVMSDQKFKEYCTWLFPILKELLEVRGTAFDRFHQRYPGRISEILMDVWINTNNYDYVEQPLIFIGGRHLAERAYELLKSKVTGEKYSDSFY